MPVPVALATFAACGSLVTSVKSGWELSRMIRKRVELSLAEEDSGRVYRALRKAYHNGVMTESDYDRWYEKFLVAKAEKDLSGLRKIRAHLRMLYDHAPMERRHRERSSRTSSSSSSSRRSHAPRDRYDDEKRRRSVHFDTRHQTIPYVPEPPQRYNGVEWPRSAGSIEYKPMNEKQEEPQLARLQRRSSVSYQPGQRHRSMSHSSPRETRRSASTSRQGRTRRHYDSDSESESDSETDDRYYDRKERRNRRR